MPSGAAAASCSADAAVLVVERGVVAVLLGEQRDLLGRPGGADDARGAQQAGDLADRRCRRHRRRRRRRRCRPRFISAIAVRPDVGREAGHAEDAEVAESGTPGTSGTTRKPAASPWATSRQP